MTAVPVRIYYAHLGDVGTEATSALLTVEDRQRLASTAHARRRKEYLTGRALLRYALQDSTGRFAHSHRLRTKEHGKPECIDGPAINLSHSGDLVACAVSPAGCVGIDVELAAPRRRTEAIAREHFTAGENTWLRAEEHDDRFYMLWVLKEAYLKAIGIGLAGGLDALECRIDPPRIEASAAQTASLALYSVGAAFLAVATIGYGIPDLRVERWTPNASASAAANDIRLIARSA